MGKRIEKAFGKDKGQASQSSQEVEEDPNKTPEPYICTGHFQADFTELCRRNHMAVIPPVVLRPHRPPSPGSAPPADEGKSSKPGKKEDKKNQPPPPPEPEPEQELDENGGRRESRVRSVHRNEPPEPPPKTYTVRDKLEYFKPTVQVEMDNPDKQDTVTELFVRGWKVDVAMMMVFKQCWPKMDRLQTINLWNAGLNEETLEILSGILPECPVIKTLVLDNNVVKAETWHQLLKEESPVQHLSLRYNRITDVGAELLGKALGSAQKQNMRLISLNLNGNQITDTGAKHLADGLRTNRTLLCLGLANNKIGDVGAQKFGEVLSRFQLTHEEIVERRKLMSEKGSPERHKPPSPGTRRADSRDRPGSVRSSHAGAASKAGKSAKAKKGDTKGKDDDKEKKSKKELGATATKRASIVADMSKTGKKGDKSKGKGKGAAVQEAEQPETQEIVNPLLDTVERLENGVIMLAGNRALISLNLAGGCDWNPQNRPRVAAHRRMGYFPDSKDPAHLCEKMSWPATLTATRLAGVIFRVTLRITPHNQTITDSSERHPGFGTHGLHHPKFRIEVSVAPQMRFGPQFKRLMKSNANLFSFSEEPIKFRQ